MKAKELYNRIKQTHPEAGWSYVKAILNDGLREMVQYKVKIKRDTIDTVINQRYYPIGSDNSDLDIDQILRVYYKASDSEYRQVPQLLDHENLINTEK